MCALGAGLNARDDSELDDSSAMTKDVLVTMNANFLKVDFCPVYPFTVDF